jgi:hypothetical protein
VGFVLVLAVILAAPSLAEAGFTIVTGESALGANDSVNWANLGSYNYNLQTAPGPPPHFSLTSQSGTTVDGAPGLFGTSGYIDLGSLNGSTALDGVASAIGQDSAVEFTFSFPQPVFAFGADISAHSNQAEVFARLIATDTQGNTQNFDLTNNSGGGFTFSGFAGVSSNTANLASLTFEDFGGNIQVAGTGLAIGKAVLDSPNVSSVPLPSTLTLAGVGIASLLGASWRRRKCVSA